MLILQRPSVHFLYRTRRWRGWISWRKINRKELIWTKVSFCLMFISPTSAFLTNRWCDCWSKCDKLKQGSWNRQAETGVLIRTRIRKKSGSPSWCSERILAASSASWWHMVSPLCVFYFSLPCFYQRPSCHAERHETIFAGAVLYADYVVVRWIVLQTMVRTLQMLEGLQMNKKAQF